MIDLRSDTVTLPSPEMREVMFRAEVGDDVYGEDPSVNALEVLAAEVMGKEAGLYVPSGTMGNMVAVMSYTHPGDEVICSEYSHLFVSEQGAPARIAGVSTRVIPQQRASLDPKRVAATIRADDIHFPRTALIVVDQPSQGWVMPLSELAEISDLAHRQGIPLHIDGARIFNAALFLGVPVRTIADYADSVMFCVSKGLAAPVGSLVVGKADFVNRARRARKVLGGGMRQAGILAAAGVYAIKKMSLRLAEDHENARMLAQGLRPIPGVRVDRDEVQTNMFFIDMVSDKLTPREFVQALRDRGVFLSFPRGTSRTLRLVAHYGVTSEDVSNVIAAVREVLA